MEGRKGWEGSRSSLSRCFRSSPRHTLALHPAHWVFRLHLALSPLLCLTSHVSPPHSFPPVISFGTSREARRSVVTARREASDRNEMGGEQETNRERKLSPDPPASSDVPTYQRFPPSRAERREARRRRGNGESSGNGQGNGAVRLIMVDLGLSLNVLSYLPA